MAFTLLDYWLERPHHDLPPETQAAFDALLAEARKSTAPVEIGYRLAAPRWQFLDYLCTQHGVALHGSPVGTIELFEPRQSSDLHAFGAQKAVYAAVDGIWPIFFAILDRQRFPTSIINACLRVEHPRSAFGKPHYFFSVERETLALDPWTPGWVYILPGESFAGEGALPAGEDTWVHVAQVASTQPVKPLARLKVGAEDFPFLAQMRGHLGEQLKDYAKALNQGLPLPEDPK